MPRSKRSFDLPALYPLFDKNVLTEIEAKDNAEAASNCRLVVAEVRVRSHVRLDEIEKVHEPIVSLVDRHLRMAEGKPSPHRHQTCISST